ncbi:TraR/DksA C4-type zinc finger protein [Candidatus Kaiserbacteria bacterium]|nr:TraR/DksA C4-type zinc finger protein [Candidatus Kaiserbacteria bacterium]
METLHGEMQKIARVNPDSEKEDWEAKGPDLNVLQADQNQRADVQREYELNNTLLKDIETRYNGVKEALVRIEDGTYGVCSVGGEQIELDRLEANPAATTCKAHLSE